MSCERTYGSATDAIAAYRGQIERGTHFIEVNRMQLSLLRQLMRIYKDRSLNLKKRIDVNFIGEQGADMGGPTKEFFHSAISCLSKVDPAFNVQLFGGLSDHLIPLYGVDAIASGCFEMAGKLIAHSILHGGPGFSGLAPAIVQYLCTGSLDKSKHLVTIEDLYDLELKEILQEQVTLKWVQKNLGIYLSKFQFPCLCGLHVHSDLGVYQHGFGHLNVFLHVKSTSVFINE